MTRTGTDDDLEFYVRKCGDILGVTGKLDKEKRDAKHVLEHIFFQVVEFKKLNQVRSVLMKHFSFFQIMLFFFNKNALAFASPFFLQEHDIDTAQTRFSPC